MRSPRSPSVASRLAARRLENHSRRCGTPHSAPESLQVDDDEDLAWQYNSSNIPTTNMKHAAATLSKLELEILDVEPSPWYFTAAEAFNTPDTSIQRSSEHQSFIPPPPPTMRDDARINSTKASFDRDLPMLSGLLADAAEASLARNAESDTSEDESYPYDNDENDEATTIVRLSEVRDSKDTVARLKHFTVNKKSVRRSLWLDSPPCSQLQAPLATSQPQPSVAQQRLCMRHRIADVAVQMD